ncbi:hypothetical protein HNQ02_000213 [Flavobacterium sp. 7E]|uniref:aromatic hydrocarbon degradation protein n=1 Tax=unclassified Flavobacterium TaxID=196869 RepID=UPI00156F12B2|nr:MULTISPECIES: aromatic hydrocarbon degradation protein [unclassified Flavobacterium]NRS87313.1 hypothetical protein [Flavobacterium sp. 7E]NRT13968.1 hypothetical protein [Flavobacterium sp. 28A]
MKNKTLLGFFFLLTLQSFSQSISSSPYSLYGLGSTYDADFGSNASIGSSGIALPSNQYINNLNPASLGSMYLNHFMFDIGGKAILTSYENSANKENRNNVQFSHIAVAFPVTKKSGFSFALKPYSSSTYKISNLALPIYNSSDYYTLDATGTGGLNDVDFSYGYKISKKLSLGASMSYLFGSTSDDKTYTIENSITSIYKNTTYNGARFSLGTQFALDSTLTIGSTIKLPTRINASKVESVTAINNSGTTTVESEEVSDVDNYYMPLEVGFGVSKRFKNNLNLTVDYGRSFWNGTNQSDLYGDFKNQDKFAIGFSYSKPKTIRSYLDRIKYSTGFNYDTGYLEVDNNKVKNMSLSLGVSLPLENTFSALNISYSYGQKGSVGNGLIKENYHKISLNLSLDGIWFIKRKID